MTVPNCLTLLRLLSLPATMIFLRAGHPVVAGCVFVAGMLTDCFDGWVARKLNQSSTFGLYLDPVVDKIVILGMFYELALAGILNFILAHLFLLRELLHDGVRSFAATRGVVVGANWMGKVKAACQTVTIAWALLLAPVCEVVPEPAGRVLALLLQVLAWGTLVMSWAFFAVFLRWNRQVFAGTSR